VGYVTNRIAGVVVKAGQMNQLDVELSEGIALDEVVVTAYKIPLIDKDNTISGDSDHFEEIRSLPPGVQERTIRDLRSRGHRKRVKE
jgi:hypothetical protein